MASFAEVSLDHDLIALLLLLDQPTWAVLLLVAAIHWSVLPVVHGGSGVASASLLWNMPLVLSCSWVEIIGWWACTISWWWLP